MTKLLKNSKSAFAFVMAFAIIAVSLFTGVAINADAAVSGIVKTDLSNVMWNDYEPDGKFITEAAAGVGDTADNPYIITSAGQLRYLAQNFTADYVGKYFKIKDGIDIISMQSSGNLKSNFGVETDVEALNKMMSLSSYSEVKTYFETYTAKRNQWQSGANKLPFDAHIDFNGATVVGMYNGNGGLFEKVGPNASFKNLKIANSYVKAGDGAGALFGTIYNYNNGSTEIGAGTVKVENLEIANTYVETTATNNRCGVLFGYTRFSEYLSLSMNNVLIYGCTSVIGGTAKNSLFGQSGTNLRPEDENEVYNWQFENSILIGIKPFQASQLTECQQIARYANFNNVYTTNFEDTYYLSRGWETKAQYENKITQINNVVELSEVTKEMTSNLDYTNTWIMTENGPQLRALHGEFKLVQTGKTHYYACEECGLKTVEGEKNHTWKVDGDKHYCDDCGYICKHTDQTDITPVAGDCVTASGTMSTCKDCGAKLYVGDTGSAPAGHDLEWVAEIPATCEKTGVKGYWHCKTCEKNFAGTGTDKDTVKWAEMNTAVADPATELATPIISHDAHDHNNGDVVLIYSNETGHWYVCYMCDGKLVTEIADELAAEGAVVSHKFKNSVCEECGYVCENHKYELTGKVITAGDCSTDTKEELKCSVCGAKSVKVTTASHKIVKVAEVAATDKLEGTKAHYECEVCHEIYVDAEGKTKATKAELVIPKVLPAGYENVVLGNTDNSNKSPATSDSVAPIVFAVVAVIATGYVLVRKFVKA